MDEILAKYREWDFHVGECPMCRLFDQRQHVRCVCHDGRALIMQIMTLLDTMTRGS
jgi:hypothetical protein